MADEVLQAIFEFTKERCRKNASREGAPVTFVVVEKGPKDESLQAWIVDESSVDETPPPTTAPQRRGGGYFARGVLHFQHSEDVEISIAEGPRRQLRGHCAVVDGPNGRLLGEFRLTAIG